KPLVHRYLTLLRSVGQVQIGVLSSIQFEWKRPRRRGGARRARCGGRGGGRSQAGRRWGVGAAPRRKRRGAHAAPPPRQGIEGAWPVSRREEVRRCACCREVGI